MDDRNPINIFSIRFSGDNVVIIRDKLGVHTRFFRDGDNSLQALILIDTKGDSDLVIGIVSENGLQIIDITDDMNIPVGFSVAFAVVKDAVNDVAPFRMGTDAVNITLRSTTIADEENML